MGQLKQPILYPAATVFETTAGEGGLAAQKGPAYTA